MRCQLHLQLCREGASFICCAAEHLKLDCPPVLTSFIATLSEVKGKQVSLLEGCQTTEKSFCMCYAMIPSMSCAIPANHHVLPNSRRILTKPFWIWFCCYSILVRLFVVVLSELQVVNGAIFLQRKEKLFCLKAICQSAKSFLVYLFSTCLNMK